MEKPAKVSKKAKCIEFDQITGTVFNIQRYSLHDGPGIRTVVFLKGCPLSCEWCCNPESIDPGPRIVFNEQKCLGDGRCLSVCPTGARSSKGYCVEKCAFCGKCVDACPSGALELIGRKMSVKEVVEEVEKDRLFYESSGGGVTLSGGEVLVQREFAVRLMGELKKQYLHIAIETCGYAQWPHVEEVVDLCDLVLYDLKHMNSDIHKRFTGVPNELILENAVKIARKEKDLVFRVPLIGDINTDPENIESVARFTVEAGVKEVHLLPYHRFGESKYKKLGRSYTVRAFTPDKETINSLRGILESHGIVVKVGG